MKSYIEIIVKTLANNHEMCAFFKDKSEGNAFANYYRRKKSLYSVTTKQVNDENEKSNYKLNNYDKKLD
jgi:hypothetical protein